jgi:hypothetical protein
MTVLLAQKITWEDFSHGFHGGRIESDEICVFDDEESEGGEKQFVQFAVQEYTSDEEDFFGTCVSKWEIILTLTDIREPEYKIERQYLIGRDYARANYAQDFCEYVVASVTKYGNLSRLPLSEFID